MGERQPANTRALMPGTIRASRLHLTSQPPFAGGHGNWKPPSSPHPQNSSSTFLPAMVFLYRMAAVSGWKGVTGRGIFNLLFAAAELSCTVARNRALAPHRSGFWVRILASRIPKMHSQVTRYLSTVNKNNDGTVARRPEGGIKSPQGSGDKVLRQLPLLSLKCVRGGAQPRFQPWLSLS